MNESQLIKEDKKEMLKLNAFGKIAFNQWVWLANQYSYVAIPAFILLCQIMYMLLLK